MDTLKNEAEKIGIVLNEKQLMQFQKYQDILLEWNEKINLTAIREPKEIEIKHFLDSITLLQALPQHPITLLDVGAGAGFPGIPLAIARPDIKVTLLEATGKKVAFLKKIADGIKLDSVESIQGRAEVFGHEKQYREQFDCVVARAVAYLPTLAEICLPFAKIGGYFIAQKQKSENEIMEAQPLIEKFGGKLEKIIDIDLPLLSGRSLVVIKKVKSTPKEFPRSGNSLKAKPPKQSFGGYNPI